MKLPAVNLDAMLDAGACARWLGISKRELLAKSKGRHASIPAVWINRRVVRFHPRTILQRFKQAV